MPAFVPPGISSLGSVMVLWVDAIATPSAPKLAELTSTTAAVDISCYLDAKWGGPDAKQEGTKDERFCTKLVLEVPGSVTFTFDDLMYVIDPQVPASISNKAKSKLTKGKTGFIVIRWGKDVDIPLAVGDIVDVYPVTLGQPVKVKGDGNSPLMNKQAIFLAGNVTEDVAVA